MCVSSSVVLWSVVGVCERAVMDCYSTCEECQPPSIPHFCSHERLFIAKLKQKLTAHRYLGVCVCVCGGERGSVRFIRDATIMIITHPAFT